MTQETELVGRIEDAFQGWERRGEASPSAADLVFLLEEVTGEQLPRGGAKLNLADGLFEVQCDGASVEEQAAYLLGVKPFAPRNRPVRAGMLLDSSCYGCLGTGFQVGFGARPGTRPCLHHTIDCEPGSCAPGCEWLEDE